MSEHMPARAGIGLRSAHFAAMTRTRPDVGWLEIHGENYFCAGGQPLRVLQDLRASYPLSIHCVGLSLGSAEGVDREHVAQVKRLVERFQPGLVSDHLSWSAVDARHFNDLLPLPYTEEALDIVCRNVATVQDLLGRPILVENVSSYLCYAHSAMPEWEFLAEASRRSGCGVLLDVNNIYVSSRNHGFDPLRYLEGIPVAGVQEIHLAGHEETDGCLIDTHSRPVAPDVWDLYLAALRRFGPIPTLIEWDADIPELPVLLAEADTADALMRGERLAAVAA